MKICVLGDADSKGKSFEKLISMILDKEGYAGIKLRVHSTGMEFDLDATHKVTGEPLICECKAQNEPVGTRDLVDFLGKLAHEDSETSFTQGKFFSLSGFNGTALKWHDDLNGRDKARFELYDANKIIEILKKHNLIISNEALDKIVRKNTEYSLGERYIVHFESYLYVVQILRVGGIASYYLILTAEGELVTRTVEDEIVKLDDTLRQLTRIDLNILENVTLSLLDLVSKPAAQISTEIIESEKDVLIALDELKTNGLVIEEHSSNLFKINTDMMALTRLTKRFAEGKNKYKFMLSKYIESVVSNDFAKYIAERFKLDLDETQMKIVIRASRIFPSVLHMLLSKDNTDYMNAHQQLQYVQHPEMRKKFYDMIFHSFANDIMMEILKVLRNTDSTYLDKKGVRGYYLKNMLKIASPTEQIFSLDARGYFYLARAKGGIKKGEIVVFDEQGELESANVLMAMDEFQSAIDAFDSLIKQKPNNEIMKAAWHHKGLCYKALKNYNEAKTCFLNALKYDENLVQALSSLAECYNELGDKDGAKQTGERLSKIRNNDITDDSMNT